MQFKTLWDFFEKIYISSFSKQAQLGLVGGDETEIWMAKDVGFRIQQQIG